MTEVEAMIASILAEPGTPEEEPSQAEALEALIPVYGVSAVISGVLDVLRLSDRPNDWDICAAFLWGATLDAHIQDVDRVIAHLALHFGLAGEGENNLAWSIVSTLKGVGYLSKYDPYSDAAVIAEIARLRGSSG